MPLFDKGKKFIMDGAIRESIVISLHSAKPDSTGSNKLSGNAYADVTIQTSDWTVSADGVATNTNDVQFPTPTGAWARPTHIAFKRSSNNDFLGWQEIFPAIKAPASGADVDFPAGALRFAVLSCD